MLRQHYYYFKYSREHFSANLRIRRRRLVFFTRIGALCYHSRGLGYTPALELTMEIRVGVLTVSDKGYRGERRDTSGPAIGEMMATVGGRVDRYEVVPDEADAIVGRLRAWADEEALDVILTTGGTGLTPRDVTPEATLSVIERQVPGVAEAMRQGGMQKTPLAMLSRAVVGVRGCTLIVNLPGSEKAVRENLAFVLPALAHAVESLQGRTGDHRAAGAAVERVQDGDR
jgi:molybdopterin adenylyltransferase